MIRGGTVYILASQPNGTLYIGVTSDLVRRVGQHRNGTTGGFALEHGVTRLVYLERYDDIRDAIDRETRLKKWNRAWKLRLIRENNPDERDLYDEVVSHPGVPLAMPSGPMDSRLRGNDGRGRSEMKRMMVVALVALAFAAPAAGQGGGPCTLAPCSRLDGNDWVRLWHRAATARDAGMQAEALRRLDSLAFWPPPVVALARWTLDSVPPDAVLLAQTDGDVLPLLGLQHTGLRPDVTVVHWERLTDGPYAAGLGLPLPASRAMPERLVGVWIGEAARAGGRPVVGALTLDADVLGRHAAAVVSAGAYQRPGAADEPPFDLAAAEASADRARGADFVGPRVSAADRDSARLASPVNLGGVVLFQLLQTAVSHAQAGDAAAAEQAYARARTFAAEAQIADDPLVAIAREWIDDALARPAGLPN